MSDIVLSVPSEIRWSPNHGGPRDRTRGVFIHATRGGALGPNGTKPISGDAWLVVLEQEYQGTLDYVDGPNASQVGPTWVVGPHKAARCISDDNKCWCQTVDNDDFLSIEIAQPAYGVSGPPPPFSDFQVNAAAEICARYAHKYGFPIIHIPKQTAPSVEVNGIIGHEDSYAGWTRGKTDPGFRWDWVNFIALTKAKYDALFVPRPPDANKAAYSLCGQGLRDYLLEHPELGVPRFPSFFDSYGDEFVWCTYTAQHPKGALVGWRKSLFMAGANPIGIMDWKD